MFDERGPKSNEKWKKEIASSVLSTREYAELVHPHKNPYPLSLENGGRRFEGLGVKHTNNPDDPSLAEFESTVEQLKPDLIVVEGMNSLAGMTQREIADAYHRKPRTREEVIQTYGESGLGLMLAVERGIEIVSPEPAFKDEIKHLVSKKFSQKDIATFYLRRMASQYYRGDHSQALTDYVEPFKQEIEKALGRNIGPKLMEEIAKENSKRLVEEVDPIPWPEFQETWGATNDISATVTEFRDQYIVKQLADLSKTHKKIAMIFGGSHVVMQEPALRKIYSPNTKPSP